MGGQFVRFFGQFVQTGPEIGQFVQLSKFDTIMSGEAPATHRLGFLRNFQPPLLDAMVNATADVSGRHPGLGLQDPPRHPPVATAITENGDGQQKQLVPVLGGALVPDPLKQIHGRSRGNLAHFGSKGSGL